MNRQQLMDIGEAAGLVAVLESLNWGDCEILFTKFYDAIEWIGAQVEREQRLGALRKIFEDAHLVRHNNNHGLRNLIEKEGFASVFSRFCTLRDSLSA